MARRVENTGRGQRREFFADETGNFRWRVPEGSVWQVEHVIKFLSDASGKRQSIHCSVLSGSQIEADVSTQIVAGERLVGGH